MKKYKVAILLGSDSDLVNVKDAVKVLEEFSIGSYVTVSSAHRSPQRTHDLVNNLYRDGVKVIIAGAGLAAHLAGVVASIFPLVVIGLPFKAGALNGVDSLYSTVQMPPGIPVATVGVNCDANAALLAVQVLAVSDKSIEKKMVEYKKNLAEKVSKKASKLDKIGFNQYIDELSKKN